MTRHITPHKGGRTARIPSGWILPETLRRIHEAKQQSGKSFSDLIEEQFSGGNMDTEKVAKKVQGDGEQCTADDVQRLIDSLDADGKQWLKTAKASEAEKWAFDVLRNSQPPL